MTADNNSKGIILIMIAMSLFAMQDSLIKFIFEQSALYEIFFGRYLVAAILLFCYIKFRGQKVTLKTHYPILTIVRVILHFFAFSFFFISLTYMQLATANALFFSCPFFVSIFAKFFLKEFIGIRRWSAIAFGFTGVLIVLNPNFSEFEFRNLLPVLSALLYAASMTITKYTSDKDDVNTQLYYFYLIALMLCGVIYVFMGSGQFNNVNFDPTTQFIFREWFSNFDYTWKFILFFGIAASIAFVCIFSAYIVASPSVVSLFEYSLIIMSMIPGYFLFNEIPSLRTLIGVICIISAGVYIYFRERVRDQYIASETPARR
ncbi:DMT family transporter [Candidatus Pelagibacter sp. HIMB1321]|uniref:DMT family transporter n=1 Tax=Candidatus Pelagibacter sp. HIMB1321 TaxID=1388755 RepID=UPI000A07E9B2|nr:DMT family transporter [Candidatus Pelagibacter sp. HIMB1321]SMF77239.1 Permease of the drug/metabolite transporter (DMT) superfamily [Candidatus Pelagibacter sp. HIMB1321]